MMIIDDHDVPVSGLRIWSPSLRVDVSQWLLSGGFASAVNAQRRPHPAGGTEEILGDQRKPS